MRSTARAAARVLARLVLGLDLALAVIAPASAQSQYVDLPFACRSVTVGPRYAGVTFIKSPLTPSTIAAAATVRRVNAGKDITVQGGTERCFYPTSGSDTYCFHARGSERMLRVTAAPSNNMKGAPVCR